MNFGQIRALILDDLIDSRITVSQANQAINDAINFYEGKTFYFNTGGIAVILVPDQEYYSVATNAAVPIENVISIKYVQCIYGGVNRLLTPVPEPEIAAAQNGSIRGMPTVFCYSVQRIRVFPIPITAGSLIIRMTWHIDDTTNDAATNIWTENASELLRQSAKRRIALNVLHDTELAQNIIPMEEEAYNALLAESRRRVANTELRSPSDLRIASTRRTYGMEGWQ